MSIELHLGPTSEKTLAHTVLQLLDEAKHHKNESDAFFLNHHENTAEKDVHCDGATHQRLATVYLETSNHVNEILLQHKRNIERALNPFWANKSNEEMDIIIKNQDDRNKTLNEEIRS